MTVPYKGFPIMMSFGLPSIHVVVPFSSVLQVSFIILGYQPPYLHAEESLYQIWRGMDPHRAKNGNFYIPSCQTKVGGHIVYV